MSNFENEPKKKKKKKVVVWAVVFVTLLLSLAPRECENELQNEGFRNEFGIGSYFR